MFEHENPFSQTSTLFRQKGAIMNILCSNLHPVDRGVRIVLGAALLAAAWAGSPWGFLGVIPLVTGVAGNCPLYTLTGIRSCATK